MADEQTPGITPGPWTVNGKVQGNLWRIDGCGEGAKVGIEMLMNPVALVKTREDAEFIATAPELLEVLEQLVDHGSFPSDIYDKARAVLQKARGR